ncbi:exopolysaccharide biosynthesis protein [Geitlerinema sp. PCC 9228]|jgi:hypothetical protein|uniref:exopolysaccharide biosynthesis protein n=1 Tax=Geitlerinema sp. PCC 9228 TaxID=111611 RepID=UPI0008F9B45D|nr:exopolysaccharide biosynthesis protein [Geitlerinema sp. PCC 9228]
MAKLSAELQRVFLNEERDSQVTLAEILELSGERTFGFLFVLLSLPSALPVPAPGYSIPFGVVMFLLAAQLIAGSQYPWLPAKWKQKSVKLQKVQGFLKTGLPWLRRIELLSRPRLSYICTSIPGRTIIGIAIALMSVAMMVPIPGTNTLPAIGIFITGFGLLDDDGAIAAGGLFVCLLGFTLAGTIVFFGKEAIQQTIELLR